LQVFFLKIFSTNLGKRLHFALFFKILVKMTIFYETHWIFTSKNIFIRFIDENMRL